MRSFNRIAVRAAHNFVKSTARPVPVASRAFSTILEKKELAEETKFIRSLEAKKQAEVRANLERILALEDHHEEKQELVKILDKKEEKKGLLAKFGLDDWKFALPVGMLVGIPAVANEVIVLDAEFQLTACFILFLSTMYTQVGPMVGKALDDYGNEVQKELKELDTAIQGQIQSAIATNEEALTLKEDFQNLYTLTDQLAVAQAEVLTNIEGHKYREAIVKKLESLYALEEAASTAIRNRVVSNVHKEVVKTFKTDKKAQENALNQAIAVLAAGTGAKLGKDVVGEAFVASIAAYKANYAKQPAGSDEILVQLEKDIAAVATAPEVHEHGGNVFLTNPVLQEACAGC